LHRFDDRDSERTVLLIFSDPDPENPVLTVLSVYRGGILWDAIQNQSKTTEAIMIMQLSIRKTNNRSVVAPA
jgi:hypothetical protein